MVHRLIKIYLRWHFVDTLFSKCNGDFLSYWIPNNKHRCCFALSGVGYVTSACWCMWQHTLPVCFTCTKAIIWFHWCHQHNSEVNGWSEPMLNNNNNNNTMLNRVHTVLAVLCSPSIYSNVNDRILHSYLEQTTSFNSPVQCFIIVRRLFMTFPTTRRRFCRSGQSIKLSNQ